MAQGFHPGLLGLGHFADQVAGQIHVVSRHRQHGADVVQTDAFGQIQEGPLFQELGGEACEGAKQQGVLAIDDAGVQVGHRHGGAPMDALP